LTQFLLLAAVLLGLALLVRRAVPFAALADNLNWWIINVALPATVLELVPALHLSRGLWFLVASQWLLAALTALLVRAVGLRRGWTRGRIGAVTLLAAFNNTAFLGFPMLEALRGSPAVTLAVIADQLGCFVGLAVGGAIVVGGCGQTLGLFRLHIRGSRDTPWDCVNPVTF
jgi:predicted permease